MLRQCLLCCAGVLAFAAAPAAAQDTTTAVRPGMSEADVRARWGEPAAVRRLNDWTYMFYVNGQRHYGLDLVLLQGGQVMDAVVRSPEHVYHGQSSSPEDRVPEFTRPQQPPSSAAPGAVTGVHVNAPDLAAPAGDLMPLKPSQNEEEYARKQEQELLAKRKKEADARRAVEEKEALRAQHFMRCPKCGQPLQEERYHRIQVDRCTACGGIWFDAGEAESLLDRTPSALQGIFGDLLKGIGGGKPTS